MLFEPCGLHIDQKLEGSTVMPDVPFPLIYLVFLVLPSQSMILWLFATLWHHLKLESCAIYCNIRISSNSSDS